MPDQKRVIWKETLASSDEVLMLPGDAVVRHVAVQYEHVRIWFECTPEAPPAPRHFIIVGTGDLGVPANSAYLGILMRGDGAIVMHAYEVFDQSY